MPRKKNKVVPESNGPIPRQEEVGSDQPTLADLFRVLKKDSIDS